MIRHLSSGIAAPSAMDKPARRGHHQLVGDFAAAAGSFAQRIDLAAVGRAVLECGHVFTTMDVADHVRRHSPDAPIGLRSNSAIGRYLSTHRHRFFIEPVGRSGARGQRWERQVPAEVAATLYPLIVAFGDEIVGWAGTKGRKLAEYLARHRGKPVEWWSRTLAARREAAREAVADDLAWDDPALMVRGDSKDRRQYRLLQSWYRHTRLRVPPGVNSNGDLVGSMLSTEAAVANPGLNFLTPEIAAYVDERVPRIEAAGGSVEVDRLRRNMLSSQPMCFNLFGALRVHPPAAAAVLSDVWDLDIARISGIDVEHAPLPASAHLDDHTAFDAAIFYETRSGGTGFVGVETKYTEPFSPKVYTPADHPRYGELTTPAHGFKDRAVKRLTHKSVNQLWRNALLVISVRAADGYGRGHVAVVARAGDAIARNAVDRLSEQLAEPADLIRACSLEDLVDRAGQEAPLSGWANAFQVRYLDLTPVS